MLEIVLPIGVLIILLLLAVQVRRHFAFWILNRTIRKAMDMDPASAPLLIARLEQPARRPDTLTGLILIATGTAFAASSLLSDAAKRSEYLQVAVFCTLVGATMALYARVQRARSGAS